MSSGADKPLVNRVAQSSLITINLEDFFPPEPIFSFDLKDFLFREIILKEKDFRNQLKEFDWQLIKDHYVALHCSADAIIPTWAYMLVTTYARPHALGIYLGTPENLIEHQYKDIIEQMDTSGYENQRVVVKGCSKKKVPHSAYVDLTAKLQPLCQSIMYGEPCSTVPIFKRPRNIG